MSPDAEARQQKVVRFPRGMRRRERTRTELLAAAEELAAKRGLDTVSVDEITASANVAKGTFYVHFTDKSELVRAIGERTRADLREVIIRTNADVEDTARRVANRLAVIYTFAIEQPLRARALLNLDPSIIDPDAPINAVFRSDVEEGIKAQRLWAPTVDAAMVAFIGAAMAAISRLSRPASEPNELYGLAADLIAVMLVGLGLEPDEALSLGKSVIEARREELNP